MPAHAQTQEVNRNRNRPMYGSVWLALFVLLRENLSEPDGPGRPAVSQSESPSRLP